jgi:hypothetical protein
MQDDNRGQKPQQKDWKYTHLYFGATHFFQKEAI